MKKTFLLLSVFALSLSSCFDTSNDPTPENDRQEEVQAPEEDKDGEGAEDDQDQEDNEGSEDDNSGVDEGGTEGDQDPDGDAEEDNTPALSVQEQARKAILAGETSFEAAYVVDSENPKFLINTIAEWNAEDAFGNVRFRNPFNFAVEISASRGSFDTITIEPQTQLFIVLPVKGTYVFELLGKGDLEFTMKKTISAQ
ncbi:hypothetical protein [Persicobacter psychrovividus]|uniref:Uncharacterized protein n=1 Tax=Persicobacter psychrovividus TaxID=387638 RepID=A0ABN6L651_9BACT|nr:hypothetical protein PEPS_09380 [Persicobacter psychrovividus]